MKGLNMDFDKFASFYDCDGIYSYKHKKVPVLYIMIHKKE